MEVFWRWTVAMGAPIHHHRVTYVGYISPHTHTPLDLDPVQVTMKFVEPILLGVLSKLSHRRGNKASDY